MDKEKTTRQRLAEWSKTPEGRESYEKVAEEMRMELALDDEVKNYFKEWVDEDTDYAHNGCAINDSNQYVSLCDCARIARHFAQWGANHTPLPEDTVLFNQGVAEGKRLMMEEAVSIIESRLSEIIGDAQPKPILRAELQELIKQIKDEK